MCLEGTDPGSPSPGTPAGGARMPADRTTTLERPRTRWGEPAIYSPISKSIFDPRSRHCRQGGVSLPETQSVWSAVTNRCDGRSLQIDLVGGCWAIPVSDILASRESDASAPTECAPPQVSGTIARYVRRATTRQAVGSADGARSLSRNETNGSHTRLFGGTDLYQSSD